MSAFKLTEKQEEATALLGSQATHVMLEGGSRSGKTFAIIRAKCIRRLAVPSRGATLRFRFNHLKSAIIYDTLPKVINLCWPGLWDACKLDKTDWFFRFPNGSEEWFGGLDDKERTEKILGNEYSDIFLNECSQIPWVSRNIAMTRLAQKTKLRLKAYYDCNPPSKAHWSQKVFSAKVSPDTRTALPNPQNYARLQMNPAHNLENLPDGYVEELEGLPERQKRRFLYGLASDDSDGALWTLEALDAGRILDDELPDMLRIIISVDPSGCAGPEDDRSDEVGVIVLALGVDGRAYVLEDLSGRFGPQEWGRLIVSTFDRWEADAVVAETNFGGAMVKEVIRTACVAAERPMVPFKMVKASRGKVVRAEPIAALYGGIEKDGTVRVGKVAHAGRFPILEDQLCVEAGTLVETDRGQIPIECLTTQDRVMTRNGYAPIKWCGQTGVVSRIIRLRVEGSEIGITPCHPVFSEVSREFVSAQNVSLSDVLSVSRNWESMAHQSHGVGVGGTECRGGTIATQKGNCFIGPFMRRIRDQFQPAMMSTTQTKMKATTFPTIWRHLRGGNISRAISELVSTSCEMFRFVGNVVFAAPKLGLLLAFPQSTVLEHARGGHIERETRHQPKNSNAYIAERTAKRSAPKATATRIAAPIIGISAMDGPPVPVYNLSVADGYLPEYFANGVLVHNCGFTVAGYVGEKSPDRADALVWGVHELFPTLTRSKKKGAPETGAEAVRGQHAWMG